MVRDYVVGVGGDVVVGLGCVWWVLEVFVWWVVDWCVGVWVFLWGGFGSVFFVVVVCGGWVV